MSEERGDGGIPPADELRDDYDEPEVDEQEKLDDAEPEDGGEEPQLETEAPAEPQRRTRPGRRERAEARELRELRAELEAIRRERAQDRTYQQPPRVDPYEQARREQMEREQVALLAPDQQAIYWNNRTEQRVAAALRDQQIQIADQVDRSSWQAACATSARRARYAQRVEELYASERAAGRSPSRETIYRYVLGDEIERRGTQSGERDRRAAQRRVERQTTAPGGAGGRSDQPRDRGNQQRDNSLAALEERIFGSGRPLW